jgi:hypothetical protein
VTAMSLLDIHEILPLICVFATRLSQTMFEVIANLDALLTLVLVAPVIQPVTMLV